MNTFGENKKLTGLDTIRFIASICVVMLHSFMQYESFFDAYIIRIFVRWAVPFFFMLTGYFLKDDVKAFVKYIVHILIQYLFWTILYALLFKQDIWSVKNFLSALRSGIIMPFWYYPTLIICACFVWLLFKFIKKPAPILIITFILFLFSIIGHTLINVPAFDFINNGIIMRLHHRIIGDVTTRDGIFWGSFYIALGKYFRLNSDNGKLKIKNYKKFTLLFIILFIITSLEEWAVVYYNTGEKDILLGTIPIVILLFMLGMNTTVDAQKGVLLRTLSTCIFLTHDFFLEIFMHKGIFSAPLFFLTLGCTLAVSAILTFISRKIKIMSYIV